MARSGKPKKKKMVKKKAKAGEDEAGGSKPKKAKKAKKDGKDGDVPMDVDEEIPRSKPKPKVNEEDGPAKKKVKRSED